MKTPEPALTTRHNESNEGWLQTLLNRATSPDVLTRLFRKTNKTDNIAHEQVRNILVVDPWALGDFVLTSPMLRELRSLFPAARITLVIYSVPSLAFARRCPYVDEVLHLEIAGLTQQKHQWRWCARSYAFAAKNFRNRNFDLAILPYWQLDNLYASSLVYFSGARWRMTYSEQVNDEKRKSNKNFDKLFTHVLDQRDIKHEVLRKLEFVTQLGGSVRSDALEVWTNESDDQYAENLLNVDEASRPMVAIGIGSAVSIKRWGPDQFADIAQWLIEEFNALIVLVGSDKDRKQTSQIVQRKPGHFINIAGITSLAQCAAVLKRCHLYIGNDSAPKHLAAATQIPVVELSVVPQLDNQDNSIDPVLINRFGVWRTKHRVVRPLHARPPCDSYEGESVLGLLCGAKDPHCILEISVEQVKTQIRDLISEAYGSVSNFPPA